MSNLPVVYSENDRHALLMQLAQKVAKQVADNPHPHEYHDAQDYHVLPHQAVTSSK